MPNGFNPGAARDVDGRGDTDKDVDGRGDTDKDVDGRGAAGNGLGGRFTPPAHVATELFGRAAELGGWLVVSFVAQIPPCGKPDPRPLGAGSKMRAVAATAERRDSLDVQKLQEQKKVLEEQRKTLEEQKKLIEAILDGMQSRSPVTKSAGSAPPRE